MPDLPPTECVSLKCDGEAVPVRLRILVPGGIDLATPMGLQPVDRVMVSRDSDGGLICVELAHDDAATVIRRLSGSQDRRNSPGPCGTGWL